MERRRPGGGAATGAEAIPQVAQVTDGPFGALSRIEPALAIRMALHRSKGHSSAMNALRMSSLNRWLEWRLH